MGRPTIRKNGRPLSATERVRRFRKKAKRTLKQIRGLDAYFTHPWMLERLLDAEPDLVPKDSTIWEPCCGNGALSKVHRTRGHRVVSWDIANYEGFAERLVDFYDVTGVPEGVDLLNTNPPYATLPEGQGTVFVRHALAITAARPIPIILLLPLQFLVADCRSDLHRHIVQAWLFVPRPTRMHRLDHPGRKASAQLELGWFLLRADHHEGPREINYLDGTNPNKKTRKSAPRRVARLAPPGPEPAQIP